MNVLKKVAATTALVVLASSMVVSGANASTQAQINAANELAAKNIINDNSANPAGYQLDQFVLRQEIAAVARGVNGVAKKATCDNLFTDVSATNPNTWACYTVEALRDANLIAANSTFRPEAKITKAESIGMVVKAACGEKYSYDASKGTTWQEQVVAFAVEKSFTTSFTDYNALATRGFVFEAGAAAVKGCEDTVTKSGEDDDFQKLLCQLDPSSCTTADSDTETKGDTDSTTDDSTTDDSTTDDSATDDSTTDDSATDDSATTSAASVKVSSETPDAATVPGGIDGLPVLKFDVTAGSEDLTVKSVVLRRSGISDEETLTGLALFTDEGRASKSKNDSQENGTEANLTLDNGGTVVAAGTTKTFTVVVDVNDLATHSDVEADEFVISVKEITASSDVEGTAKSNTFRVGSRDAASIEIKNDGTVSNAKIGEKGADIFKFEVKGASDEDVVLKTITFKADSSDAEDDLANLKLEFNNKVVSEGTVNGKYVTFNLGDGVVIKEDNTESFKVTGDIVSGATDTLKFYVDKSLDVTGIGQKYGYGLSVTISDVDSADDGVSPHTEISGLTIEAGELSLKAVDAPNDTTREDKDNVELGSIEVSNKAGNELELQKFAIQITTAPSTGSGVTEVLENVEAVIGGSTYELTTSASSSAMTATFSDNDLNIALAEGDMTIKIIADVKDNVPAGTKITIALAVNNNSFYVEETEDDKQVTDIAPSSLSFDDVEVIEAGASVAKVPLANVTVVRGAEDLVAMEFEVEADEASAVTISEVVARLNTVNAAIMTAETTPSADPVNTVRVTPGNVGIGDIFIIYFDGVEKARFTATAATVANVTAGLTAKLGSIATDVTTHVDIVTNKAVSTQTLNGDAADTEQLNVWPITTTTTYTSKATIAGDAVTGVYSLTVGGTVRSYTATSSDTLTTIATAIAALDAKCSASGKVITCVSTVSAAAATLTAPVTPAATTTGVATSQEISKVSLYKGSTLLDEKSGSQLTSGLVTFNVNPEVTIAADATDKFTIKIDIVDSADVVANSPITATLVSVKAKDDDNDDVKVSNGSTELSSTNVLVSGKDIAVTNSGVLAAAYDTNNDDNEDPKTILAGTSVKVASVDVQATNEEIDVDEVVFTVSTDLTKAVTSASLYLDDALVATNSSSDITATTIKFDNLSNLVIPEETAEIRLELNTSNIGYQKVGETIIAATVTKVDFKTLEGVQSGKTVADIASSFTSKAFTIAPVTVIASAVSTFGSNAKIKLTVDTGDNKQDASNSNPSAVVKKLTFSTEGNLPATAYKLKDKDDTVIATGVVSGSDITFTFSTAISDSEEFTITTTLPVSANNYTWNLDLLKNGIDYDVTTVANSTGLKSNATAKVSLGSSNN